MDELPGIFFLAHGAPANHNTEPGAPEIVPRAAWSSKIGRPRKISARPGHLRLQKAARPSRLPRSSPVVIEFILFARPQLSENESVASEGP
jgi:hypothetical protein